MDHIRALRRFLNRLKREKTYDADRTNQMIIELQQLQDELIYIHAEYDALEKLIEDLFEMHADTIKGMPVDKRNKVREFARRELYGHKR